MTAPQPDPTAVLQSLQTTITELSRVVTELRRTVEGDQAVGAPSIRQAVKDLQDEHRKQAKEMQDDHKKQMAEILVKFDALNSRFSDFEQEREVRDARLEGQNNMIKWLGGGSLVTALGVIAALAKLFGWGA